MNRREMMGRDSLTQTWMALVGIVLLAVGALGFIQNPIVYSRDALLLTDSVHNIVHFATGALALYIAFGMRGEQQINATIGFGILYVVIFAAVLISPTLFGIFSVAANTPLHVIHAAVLVGSLGIGYMARNAATTRTGR